MIQENISLKPYNTFGVEAQARYFAEAGSVEELQHILQDFRQRAGDGTSLPVLILGGGSNVLFTKDFPGLVLKLNLKGISEQIISDNEVLVTAASGECWHDLVMYCVDKDYGGLENLALIPGNAGTSPMQNIGAYGVELKDHFESLKALNLETLETVEFDRDACEFGYRDSYFKNEGKGRFIILEVSFRLTTKDHKICTEYAALHQELERMGVKNPGVREVADAVISIRKSKLPDPHDTGNAGSFFKNPVISAELFENVKHRHPEIPAYGNGETVKVPAGWLIEHCGWKGRQLGNVAAHERQALVLVNKTGEATGQEILDFSQKIIDSVYDAFGIVLEREVNVV